jgi:DNA repair exonuclease SbcCD nuclease subunit
MKFAYTADWHLSGYTQDKIINGLPERLYEKKVVQENIGNYCRLNEIKTIIIGGDLLHNKSIIYSLAQSILLDFFREYKDLNFIVLDGNHDLSGKGSDVVSALKSLDNEPNVRRVSKPTKISDNSGLDILIVPYSDNMIDAIKKSSAKYLISHFGLNEGTLNSGVSIISDIGLKDLVGKYQYVLLGHYHKPQEITKDNISVYYSGSITQNDWGEKGEEKRFLIVDTDTDTIESVPTKGYKKYFDLQITEENKTEVIKKARELKEEGHNVKITRKEAVDIDDINKEFMVVDKVEKDITNRGLSSTMSMRDKLMRYLEVNEIPEDKRDIYLQEALDIVNSVAERK